MSEIFTCEQGSDAWCQLRLGIPTASQFATILGVKKDGREKATRQTYLYKLAGERLTGEPMETYTNAHMERGKLMEEEARHHYAFLADVELERVGFIRNGDAGCSPDALVGPDGVLEIKTALPHILADLILKDDFPPEHKAQCQGALWIAERDYVDITVYWPKMPRFIKRAGRDEKYIRELADAVAKFNAELDLTVARLRRYGLAPAERATELADLLRAG